MRLPSSGGSLHRPVDKHINPRTKARRVNDLRTRSVNSFHAKTKAKIASMNGRAAYLNIFRVGEHPSVTMLNVHINIPLGY